jgi:hypothetical protein
MSMLERLMAKFRAADTNGREELVTKAADSIERTWTEDTRFDRDAMISVCDLSAKLGHSHVFLAYSRTPVRQN